MTVKERRLAIRGVLDQVSVACNFVVEQAREAGLDERAIHHCYLAVDEACTNVVEHGYSSDCSACVIDVVCQQDETTLTIIIMDDSPAFDPTLQADPDPKTPISERSPGGWGIFFIKKLMDKVTYSYEDNRNRLVMVKEITQPVAEVALPDLPQSRPLNMTVLSEKIWMITPSGRLDAIQSSGLEKSLLAQIEAGHKWLILDLSEVDYISSAGLKVLVSVWQRVRDQKGDLALAALKPRVREVLEMIGLDLVISIVDTPDQARAYFASRVK